MTFERFANNRIEELERIIQDLLKDRKETYEQGLIDAWEAARKIALTPKNGGFSVGQISEIFGSSIDHILNVYKPAEAIAKIKKYEEEQKEIKVGDEVIENDDINKRGVVTNIKLTGSSNVYNVLWDDGRSCGYYKKEIKKTDRHFPQIEELLKAMKEE